MKKVFYLVAFLVAGPAMAQPFAIQLGNNPNAFSCAEKGRSNLWYDHEINSISFIHKSDTAITNDAGTGFYRYDLSTNGGNTWSVNQGPVYSNLNDKRGGYPINVLANPVLGNIVPANAFLTYGGAWKNNSGSRSGNVYGVGYLNGSGYIQHYDSLSYAFYPENMTTLKFIGEVWMVGGMFTNDSDNVYVDSIVVAKGVWNGITMEYDFSYKHLYVPVNPDLGSIVDVDIAFDDFGSVGYIAMITNNDPSYSVFPDSVLYLSVLKTTDQGASWYYTSGAGGRPDILDLSTAVDSLLANNNTLTYGTMYDLDLVVDQNSNLHILTGVSPSRSFEVAGDDAPGTWGMFDIYTENSGTSWKAQLLSKPVTFRGTFGDGSAANPLMDEDNRPFASRNWEGDKLFFSWFDTDTVAYGTDPNFPRHNNKFPDLYTIGYNVVTNMWTDVINLTQGTNADGACSFGNGSYYVIDSLYLATGGPPFGTLGNIFSIPVVYQELQFQDPTQTGSPTAFRYIQNANVNMNGATHPGNPVLLPDIQIFVENRNSPLVSISPNYPNPFNGKTSFDVNLSGVSRVTIEISNILGEVLSLNKYANLNSGFHTLTLDGSTLSPGIYIYKVKAGNAVKAGKMIVN